MRVRGVCVAVGLPVRDAVPVAVAGLCDAVREREAEGVRVGGAVWVPLQEWVTVRLGLELGLELGG